MLVITEINILRCTVSKTSKMKLNNTALSWPEDGRLTAETCRQV